MKSRIKRKKIELELAEFDMEDIEFEAQKCLNAFNQKFIHESKLRENEEAKKKLGFDKKQSNQNHDVLKPCPTAKTLSHPNICQTW